MKMNNDKLIEKLNKIINQSNIKDDLKSFYTKVIFNEIEIFKLFIDEGFKLDNNYTEIFLSQHIKNCHIPFSDGTDNIKLLIKPEKYDDDNVLGWNVIIQYINTDRKIIFNNYKMNEILELITEIEKPIISQCDSCEYYHDKNCTNEAWDW
jgi:hypothetical protein